ncbi:DUF3043 domain-containing protein [Flavimobilis sp. GY10621]|uniref:DUF3043 domain-containing protein n=1 Tax=Flavimobilis rhizosphaerae TaxID=2775421 RepID=A0ABR9DTA0_9MICO|nr:DUF3043 domain-containing protein [Flavimobilis rhizosphaerae]MBD9700228.1 DUF3043 domain-containing protein [Flavimobilis rhizosphaerae]
MFKKNRPTEDVTPQPVPEVAPELDHTADPRRKSGPTPRRSEVVASNKVPLVANDRRAAAKAQRAEMRKQRDIEYQAMLSGDERHLPYRDKGPVKRFVRDWVDARRNLGEIFLFFALAMMVVLFITPYVASDAITVILMLFLYGVVLVTIADGFLLWRKLRKALVAKFGDDVDLKAQRWYALTRAYQIRRARLPKPQVKHGEYPS